MKKLRAFLAALLIAALPACGTQPAEPVNTPEPGYIWTVTIDGTQSRAYGGGQLTASYTVSLSASMEGGDSPEGEYRGELRVEYEGVPDQATIYAISLLKGSYDFEGWGESGGFSFVMEPYDQSEMMDFVAGAYQGEGARSAPLLEGVAMYSAQDVAWTESDWEMWLDAGLDGVFGVDARGDESGASSSVYTPFGGGSAGSEGGAPLRLTIIFIDENRARLDIWSHGGVDVDLSFTGALEKTALSDTVKAG